MPLLAGTGAGSYQILSYTWTFPGGALKGYGTFATNTNDPSGPYVTFTGDPTSASNTTVQVVSSFSQDDLTNQQGAGVNDPDIFNQFYWGPTATGNQTVSVSALIQNTTTKATMTLSDSATNNVVKPQGFISQVMLGTAGLSTGGANVDGYQFIGIDKGTTVTSHYFGPTTYNGPSGFAFQAGVRSTGGVSGTFAIVQTITTNETRSFYGTYSGVEGTQYQQLTFADGTLPSGPLLDGSFPYGGNTSTVASNMTVPFDDNPLTSVAVFPAGTPYNLSRTDSFTDTLMFDPGGIWIPVGSITWNWSASADYNSTTGVWSQDSANQSNTGYLPASGNGDFPVWTHTASEQTTWSASA